MSGRSGQRNLKRPKATPRELRERRPGTVPLGWRPAEGAPGSLEPCAYELAVAREVARMRRAGVAWGKIPAALVAERWWPRVSGRWMPGATRPRGTWSVNTIKKLAALVAAGAVSGKAGRGRA